MKNDPVNHPSHYTSGKIEVIDFIEDQRLDFHCEIHCSGRKERPEKISSRFRKGSLVSQAQNRFS